MTRPDVNNKVPTEESIFFFLNTYSKTYILSIKLNSFTIINFSLRYLLTKIFFYFPSVMHSPINQLIRDNKFSDIFHYISKNTLFHIMARIS